MASRPQDALDEKLAPKLKDKVLRFISGLLVAVGKPFFLILILPLTLVLILLQVKKRYLKFRLLKFFSIIQRKPEKGVIFSSNWLKVKIVISVLKKKFGGIDEFLWRAEVFSLAVEKLFYKSLNFARIKFSGFQLKRNFLIFSLKTKLKLISLVEAIPRPRLPKISKLKLATFLFGFISLSWVLAAIFFWAYVLRGLPPVNKLRERSVAASTKIYDREGILLYTIFKDQNRTPVKLEDIPSSVRLATIAIEDAEFYSHPGFSVKGIARAIIKNLKKGELSGGSTITQQLVKNTLLSPEKTLLRKLKEIVLAIQVELTYSKDEILEMYLNEVSYGGTAYGVQEASRMYFDKDVDKLTLGEAALLAGLPKSPTKYSPFGGNPETARLRQKEVLRLMQENGFISEGQRREAEAEELKFAQNKIPIKAPHFVFWVRELLEERLGPEMVEKGGLEVVTTLDYRIQALAEEVVRQEVEKLKRLNVTNGAAIVLNPQTGEILAMVGSKDYFDSTIDGNVNITTRPRQPGSSIKVVNYAYALSNGFTPATIIPDSPVTFLVEGQPPYTPKNYEGRFRGNLSLRSAFAESRNIPAVRVLATYGVKNMLQMGQKLGITTWTNPSDYGLSLTLGGGEVTLLDLARVYSTIANFGRRVELASILKITDYKGSILEEFDCPTKRQTQEQVAQIDAVSAATESAFGAKASKKTKCNAEQVLDPRVAFLLTDILRDNTARAPAFGTQSLLVIPGHKEVAVKTGTSNDLRDNLAIGYTQDYVVATWVGNNDNSQMSRIASGVTGATPIFNKIMTALLSDKPNHDWPIPPGLVQLPICPYTGTLACEGCPVVPEWFLDENKPEKVCKPDWFNNENQENSEQEKEPKVDVDNQLFKRLLRQQAISQ